MAPIHSVLYPTCRVARCCPDQSYSCFRTRISAEAKIYEPLISAFLLDTGRRSGRLKQLGGTGKTHDWSISAEIVKSVKIPVILAGGLNAQNVKQAIEYVKPYAVDVCSGVRTGNRLDPAKLSEFISIVRTCNDTRRQ